MANGIIRQNGMHLHKNENGPTWQFLVVTSLEYSVQQCTTVEVLDLFAAHMSHVGGTSEAGILKVNRWPQNTIPAQEVTWFHVWSSSLWIMPQEAPRRLVHEKLPQDLYFIITVWLFSPILLIHSVLHNHSGPVNISYKQFTDWIQLSITFRDSEPLSCYNHSLSKIKSFSVFAYFLYNLFRSWSISLSVPQQQNKHNFKNFDNISLVLQFFSVFSSI